MHFLQEHIYVLTRFDGRTKKKTPKLVYFVYKMAVKDGNTLTRLIVSNAYADSDILQGNDDHPNLKFFNEVSQQPHEILAALVGNNPKITDIISKSSSQLAAELLGLKSIPSLQSTPSSFNLNKNERRKELTAKSALGLKKICAHNGMSPYSLYKKPQLVDHIVEYEYGEKNITSTFVIGEPRKYEIDNPPEIWEDYHINFSSLDVLNKDCYKFYNKTDTHNPIMRCT